MAKSNIFEATIEYRLVDNSGIVLSVPNYLVIDEPVKFEEAIIVLERKEEDRGGVNFEYGDSETLLGFHGGGLGVHNDRVKDVITSIMDSAGSDADIMFEVRKDGTLIYQGNLIGSTFEEGDSATYFRVKRFDADNKIKTRWKVPINLESTTDLDGTSVGSITTRSIPMHSSKIKKTISGNAFAKTSPTDERVFQIDWDTNELNDVDANNFGYWLLDTKKDFISDVNGWQEYGDVLFGPNAFITTTFQNEASVINDSNPVDDEFYRFQLEERRAKVTIDSEVNCTVTIRSSLTGGEDTWTSMTMTFQIEVGVYNSLNQPKGTGVAGTSQVINVPSGSGPLDFDTALSIDLNTTIDMEEGDRLYIWVHVNPTVSGLVAVGSNDTIDVRIVNILDTSYITVDVLTEENPTLVEGLYYKESLQRALLKATGLSNILESSLFDVRPVDSLDEGCGGLNVITTGEKIRGRSSDMVLSIEQLISYAINRHGCGFSLYYDGSTLKLLLEKQRTFFADQQIMSIANLEFPTIRRVNKSIIFNELKVGYEKFARPNEQGTSEGIATQSTYLTPIVNDDKSLQMLSKIIADGTEIERVRRNGIENADDESDEKDDDVFVISMWEFDDDNEFSPALYGSGENLNVQRDADNDRIIINGLIIIGVAANNYIFLDGFTNRQISGTPILDYNNNRTILPCTTETQNDTIYPDFHFRESNQTTIRRVYSPRRLEGFSNVSGLIDKESVYNLDHASTQILIQNFGWIAGGLQKKAGADLVRFLQKKSTTDHSKEYDTATCSLTDEAISDKQDFTLTDLRAWSDEIFGHFVYELQARMTYLELITLKEALRNEGDVGKRYGYITFDYKGSNIDAYPFRVEYNPLSERVKIIAWEKA